MADPTEDKFFAEEDFENASDDAEFEIELGDDETSESNPKEILTLKTDDDSDDDDDDSEGLTNEERQQYGKRAQKRIKQLVTQKKEADQKLADLQSSVQELERTTATYQTQARNTDEQLLTDYIQRNEVAADSARSKLRRAKEDGDIEGEMAAQEEMASNKAEQLLLKQYKRQYDGMQAASNEDARNQPAPVDTRVIATERQKAYEWMRKNTDDDDRDMTLVAEQIHHTLISEGHRPINNPDSYYAELDARMAKEFPDGLPKSRTTGGRKVTQKVGGGGTRSAQSSMAIRSGKARVSLTKSEIATARQLNIPLQEYAKEKHKLEQQRG